MTVLPLFHRCKEQYGELCCCKTCCDFFLKQGHCCVLTLILYFHLVSMLIHPMFFIWYLVLYAYTVYINIYILHIFLYLCLLLSWEWCDYVISLWSLIILTLLFWKKKLYSHLQWDNYSPNNFSLLCEYLKPMNSSSQLIYFLFHAQFGQLSVNVKS